jgi:hypothetical protein
MTMSRARPLTWCFVLLCLAFFWEMQRMASRQQELIADLEHKIADAQGSIRRLNREADTPTNPPFPPGISSSKAASGEPPPAPADAEATPTPAKVATPLEASVAGLRTLLQRNPQWSIPEIDLLGSGDLVLFAADLEPDAMQDESGQRKVLRDLRSLAKREFAKELEAALSAYLSDHAWNLPSDVGALAAYFPWRVPPAILERYEVAFSPASPAGLKGGNIRERTPVDPDYDTNQVFRVDAARRSVSWMQMNSTPAAYVILRSRAAFASAHGGRDPEAAEQLLPYLESPAAFPQLQVWFNQWRSTGWPEERITGQGGISVRVQPSTGK